MEPYMYVIGVLIIAYFVLAFLGLVGYWRQYKLSGSLFILIVIVYWYTGFLEYIIIKSTFGRIISVMILTFAIMIPMAIFRLIVKYMANKKGGLAENKATSELQIKKIMGAVILFGLAAFLYALSKSDLCSDFDKSFAIFMHTYLGEWSWVGGICIFLIFIKVINIVIKAIWRKFIN